MLVKKIFTRSATPQCNRMGMAMKTVLLVFGLCPLVLSAQNLVRNGDAESGLVNWPTIWATPVELSVDNPHSGTNCFKLLLSAAESEDLIPVDPAKTYRLSGWFKSADDKTANLFLGLMPCAADKKQVLSSDVGVIPKTETELVETCRADDTVVVIKDGRQWKAGENYSIAFDADITGAYLDLPNRNRSGRGGIARLENFDDKYWEITLTKPCGIRRPAGTKVREHVAGSTFMYPARISRFKSADWVKLSGEIKGMSQTGAGSNQFWRGTQYVRVVILSLNGSQVFVDDLVFEELGASETGVER